MLLKIYSQDVPSLIQFYCPFQNLAASLSVDVSPDSSGLDSETRNNSHQLLFMDRYREYLK